MRDPLARLELGCGMFDAAFERAVERHDLAHEILTVPRVEIVAVVDCVEGPTTVPLLRVFGWREFRCGRSEAP